MYFNGDPVSSIGLRLHMWDGAIRIFMDNPLIGVGTGGYQLEMTKHGNSMLPASFNFSQPHNSFLYMAVSFGILGFAVLCWMFYAFLKVGWRHRDNLLGFSILSYGIIMVTASITDSQIIEVHSAILFALFAGLQTSLRGSMEKERAI
jgi:O-antigen ligase